MNRTDYTDKEPAYFARARTDIAPLLPPQPQRVLEFGCGSGATLAWLKRAHGAQATVGVEIEPSVAEQARARVDRVLTLDAERDTLPADLGRFDLLLCLDVLEHFRDPWRFLEQLVAEHLEEGGVAIASVPNIRHASVLLPLMFRGRWRYAESGILDRTHLRFFTRESAIALMSVPGLEVTGVVDTPLAGSRSSRIDRMTLGLFTPFLAVQTLVAARRVPVER